MNNNTETFVAEDSCAANSSPLNVCTNPDDLLEPLERLEKYAVSDIVFHRQVGTRSILETLHEVRDNEDDVRRVMNVVSKFASDAEPSIRVELVEQLPHIASYFISQIKCLSEVFFSILPLFEHFLTDNSAQVRKVAQNSLAVMMEQGFVSREFVEVKICSVLVQLMEFNLDDYRMEAIITISKIIRFLGKETTERLFIEHFTRLCSDSSFNVRRVCASNFGEFCTVLGQEVTDDVLLPQFKLLCEDGVWGVRKACADVFIPVSCVCSNEARRNVLASLFVNLLRDHSRWVKTAAFQSLGPFISTFADPTKTGLYYNNGTVVFVDETKDQDSNDSGCSVDSSENVTSPEFDDCDVNSLQNADNTDITNVLKQLSLREYNSKNPSQLLVNDSHLHLHFDNESAFNNFQYWRIPIPELEIDIDIEKGKTTSVHVRAKVRDSCQKVYSSNVSVKISQNNSEDVGDWTSQREVDVESHCFSAVTDAQGDATNTNIEQRDSFPGEDGQKALPILSTDFNSPVSLQSDMNGIKFLDICEGRNQVWKSQHIGFKSKVLKKNSPKQNIIPAELLEHYLSMINPVNYQTIDPELSHHCAYSLPAVALTLGRKYWPCLKETYETLASDMQWSVRWTLASSLHQMSLILGPEYTSRDLLPIFLSFMKDLDEVRFGILQNLAAIVELFSRTEQLGILPKISEFLKMDNHRNWRFRLTLAHQVMAISSLYSPAEIKEYLVPIGFTLINDKVSEVRLSAISVLSTLLKRIFCDTRNTSNLSEIELSFIGELKSSLAFSRKWFLRQAFVLLCERMVVDSSVPLQVFYEHILECLLTLSSDPVPNVRLVLSRILSTTLNGGMWLNEEVQNAVKRLQLDKDLDVRRYLLSTGCEHRLESNCLSKKESNVLGLEN